MNNVPSAMQPAPLFRPWQMQPIEVLFSTNFWRKQGTLVGVLLISCIGVCFLFPLTYPGEESRSLIGGARYIVYAAPLLYLILPIGIVQTFQALEEIFMNDSLARQISLFVQEHMPRADTLDADRPSLENMELWLLDRIRSTRKGGQDPTMLRLSRALCKNAQDRRFDPVEVLLRPYREESGQTQLGLESLQKTALRLGILGAFVGLLYSILQIPEILRQMSNLPSTGEASAQLQGTALGLFRQLGMSVFSGLAVKFGASVAGLYVAVVLSMLISVIRKERWNYLQAMETAAANLGSLALRCKLDQGVANALDRIRAELKESLAREERLQTLLREVASRVNLQTETIAKGILELGQARSGYDGLLEQVAKQQVNFLSDMRALYDAATLRKQLLVQQEEIRKQLDPLALTLEKVAQQTRPWWRKVLGM